MSKLGQNSMKKWLFFAIILPWMANYGSERSFLLIFSVRDDLVKVSCKSDAWKCQNQVTLLTLTSWVEGTSPFSCYTCLTFFYIFIFLHFHIFYCRRFFCHSQARGPPLFGLYPNGLYPNGLSLNGLQGQLDYPQLDYLWRLDYRRLDYKPLGLPPNWTTYDVWTTAVWTTPQIDYTVIGTTSVWTTKYLIKKFVLKQSK